MPGCISVAIFHFILPDFVSMIISIIHVTPRGSAGSNFLIRLAQINVFQKNKLKKAASQRKRLKL